MRTIYEKEALFESLDAAVAELKEYIVGAVHRAELHQVEQQMFRQLQQVGRHGLETFVALSGTGYEAANPPLSEEGSPLEYKGTETKGSPYVSIFGGIQIYRAAYAHPLDGKKSAFDHMLHHVHKRDPQGQKPLVALLDGDPYLEDRLRQELALHGMEDRLDALILDLIHASEYLWDVSTALYGEKSARRIHWIEEKLYALLEGNVGYLIGGLRQRLTKNRDRLTSSQKKTLEKTITYFENHRHMMHYDVYLNKGYPIATGVVEGTCGSLVKDRMEQSGMRWSIHGAQAVLAQRAVVKNGDWDSFFTYYIDAERDRLYPTIYERENAYQRAA